jgi:ribosomal protein S18 acetylase RimI-like enzyme
VIEAVRPATQADLADIAELARAAVAELSETKGGAVWARREGRVEPFDDSLRAEIDDPAVAILVGTIDDIVVGYAVASVEVLPDGGKLARLTDLYVDAEAREVGVGELLLDTVLSWAAEGGCFGIDSIVLPGNRETKNFFESAGMVARAIIVHRPLP